MNLKRNNVSKQGTTLNNLLISMQTSDSVSLCIESYFANCIEQKATWDDRGY